MAERKIPEESADARAGVEKMSIDDVLDLPPPGPADIISESGFSTKLAYEDEDGQSDDRGEESESRQAESTNSVAEALPTYPSPGRTIRVKESAPNAPPLPRLHEGTRAESGTHEEGAMANGLLTTDALDEDAPVRAQGASPERPAYPPPGPPVLISDTGIGIERKRREAREEWERTYGSGRRDDA